MQDDAGLKIIESALDLQSSLLCLLRLLPDPRFAHDRKISSPITCHRLDHRPQIYLYKNGSTRLDYALSKKHKNKVYAAKVQTVDENVARVRNTLERCGLTKNTVIIFTSDNGGLSNVMAEPPINNTPLRAGKGSVYNGGFG